MPAQVVGTGQGKVKFFNTQKGFGFIQRDEGGEDVFVHISQVERAGLEGLAEGQELQFNLVDRGGKVSAADLQVVGDVIPVEQRAPQRELTGEKATGTVKFFNTMKGFGSASESASAVPDSCGISISRNTMSGRVLAILYFANSLGAACGVLVAGFGAGYSSISYLGQFAIDGVKLDRSFTRNRLRLNGRRYQDNACRTA